MRTFLTRGRRPVAADPETSTTLTPGERLGLPHRFEAVGEALVSGSNLGPACVVAGRELARDGASVQEAMEALRQTWQLVRRTDPDHDATASLVVGWSEATLGYLHQLSCEDALTGLASQAHLRTRLSELFREPNANPNQSHALIVCELSGLSPDDDHLTRSMRLARVGETARTVFAHGQTVAVVGASRVAVLSERDDRIGRRVRLLRTMLDSTEKAAGGHRVWIEGLPATDATLGMLLDELARR